MYLNSKKANFPLTKVLVILLISIIILITYIIILSSYSISIDEKKIKTQIIQNQLINKNCFSNDFAKINEIEFTQENFNACLKNINDEKTLVRIELKNISIFYSNEKKEEFIEKVIYCKYSKVSILCSEIHYPIIFKNKNNVSSNENLIIQTILTN